MKGKFPEKGSPIIMAGYAENHAHDLYWTHNPSTVKVLESREIHTWSNRSMERNDLRMTL